MEAGRTGEEASVWGCVPPAAAEGWPFVLHVDVVRGRPSLAVDGAEGTGRDRSGDTADGGSGRAPAPISVCQRDWEDQTRVSAKPCSACWVAFGHHRGAPGWLEMCLQSPWGGGCSSCLLVAPRGCSRPSKPSLCPWMFLLGGSLAHTLAVSGRAKKRLRNLAAAQGDQ